MEEEQNAASATGPAAGPESTGGRRRRRRLVLLLVAAAFLVLVMREVLFPYRGQEYAEIPHGDHTHYVPKDRDPDVSVSNFPTTRPGPNERILPDGRVVPRQ